MNEKEFKNMDLSNCEKMILGCIYDYNQKNEAAPNVRDIMVLIEEKHNVRWKMQTVCTFFSRMEKKGLITTEKQGRYTYYYPVVPYDVYVRYELMELCNIYFENDEKKLKQFVRLM